MDLRLTQLTFRDLVRTLADLLMPRVCAVCGRQLLPRERHLCLECEADLPLTHFGAMPHNPMADAFNALVDAPAYVRAAALFYYSGDYRRITQAVKYSRNFGLGREFGRRLGESLAAWQGVDLVCPVPLHWTRRYRRGYNQAEIIGREVARALGAAFEPRLLRRARRTRSQTSLGSGQRAVNVSGAFRVRPGALRALRARFEALGAAAAVPEGRLGAELGAAAAVPERHFGAERGEAAAVPERHFGAERGEAAAAVPEGRLGAELGAAAAVPEGPAIPDNSVYDILLVDDVFTTGATLAACYAALRSAFGPGVRISVATLAYVDNG